MPPPRLPLPRSAAKGSRGANIEGGLGKPLSWEDCERIMCEAGLTAADMRHAMQVNAFPEKEQKGWFQSGLAQPAGSMVSGEGNTAKVATDICTVVMRRGATIR
jgi:hypothetical protein